MARAIWYLALCVLTLSAGNVAHAQERAAQAAQDKSARNLQDQAVKLSGQSAPSSTDEKPLDEQKSAPVQVLKRDYDMEKLTHEPAVPAPVFRGRVLWVQKCAFCHDGLGQPTYKTMGPWLDGDLVRTLSDKVIKIVVQNGSANMPAFKYDLSDAQLDDVLTFLKTVPASGKPTPAQLAGVSEGGASSD